MLFLCPVILLVQCEKLYTYLKSAPSYQNIIQRMRLKLTYVLVHGACQSHLYMVIRCIDNRHRSIKRRHLSRAFSFFSTIYFHFLPRFFSSFCNFFSSQSSRFEDGGKRPFVQPHLSDAQLRKLRERDGTDFLVFFIPTCEVYVLTLAVSFCTTLSRCVQRENFSTELKHHKLSNNYLIIKQNYNQNMQNHVTIS